MEVYTKGAAALKDLGGFPKEPSVSVQFRTKVFLIRKIDPKWFGQFNTDIWFEVRVLDDPLKGTTGYLPAADLELGVSPEALVLRTHDIAPNIGTVRYGMWTKGSGQEADPHRRTLDSVVWQGTCASCGESSALHVMPETHNKGQLLGTKDAVLKLAEAIDNAKTILGAAKFNKFFIKPDSKEVMIGVLHVEGFGKVYAGHSNKQDSDAFRELAEGLGFVYAPPVTPQNIKNRRWRLASTDGTLAGQTTLQSFDYQCAAPRLIQKALADDEYPVAMSEIYYIPGKKRTENDARHGHSIPSCARCRKTVPYMLCPE